MSSIISIFLFEIYALLNPNLFPGYGHMSNNKINDKQKNITDILYISFSGIKDKIKIKKKPKKTKTVCLKKKK